MAIRRMEPLGRVTYSAGTQFNIDISNKPYTITAIAAVVRADVTTGAAAGTYDDPWDRIIAQLGCTVSGRTIFSFTDMRVAYYQMRAHLDVLAPRRPDAPGNSATNFRRQFAYVFHFGVSPARIKGIAGSLEGYPFDLTAGIPPAQTNATISGLWAAANAPGSGWTVNPQTEVEFYAFGVQPEPGDPPDQYLPQAFPNWFMDSPSLTGTSIPGGSSYPISVGMFLRSLVLVTYSGANSPRSDQVLNSIRLRHEFLAYDIFKVESVNDVRVWKAAEILTQLYNGNGWPPVGDPSGTPGVAVVNRESDMGVVYIPVYLFTGKGRFGELYGADLRAVPAGSLKLYFGVQTASGSTLNIAYQKYDLNPEHPANQEGPVAAVAVR